MAYSSDRRTPEDLQALVRTQIDQAVSFVDGELSPERARLAAYFEGDLPDVDADEGRSRVVMPVVRDAINAMKPGLMRTFFGPERVVEFRPRVADKAPQAHQQTEYINYIVTEDNPGFTILGAAVEDALVKDFGVVKWWWDDRDDTEGLTYEHLTLPELELMMAQSEAEPGLTTTIESIEPNAFGGLKVAMTRVRSLGRARLAAVPPEEFLFNRSARSIEQSTFVAHRSRQLLTDLVAMGYDQATLEEAIRSGEEIEFNEEAIQRAEWALDASFDLEDDPGGEAGKPLQKIKYVESYLLYDHDKDGIAELRKVCTVGNQYMIVHNEPAMDRPFALFMADPKPHTMQGRGVARRIAPYQAVNSVIARGTLDSLNLSIVPRQEVVEGQVNMKDVLNPELGAVIRTKQPGMLREVKHSFVGPDTLPMLDYFTGKVEDATGTSRAAAGLNPDALQSSTKAAVAATVSASQQQVEMVARNLAETGFKPLFRGIYRLVKMHQSESRMVKLFGEYVQVDPSSWDSADPDVTVNVALGMGLTEDRIMALSQIEMSQKEILTTMGLENPFVTPHQLSTTLNKKVQLAGWKDSNLFFNMVPPDWKAPPPQPPEPPPPDPVAVQLAQIEAQKVQGQQAEAQARLQLDTETALATQAHNAEKLRLEDARARDQMIIDVDMERMKLEAEHTIKIALAEIQAARNTAITQEPG